MSHFTVVDGLKYRIEPTKQMAVAIQCDTDSAKICIPKYVENCIVREIASDIFNNNQTLKEIQMPDTIQKIHFCAFRNAYNLEKVNIYTTGCLMCLLTVDMLAFADCCNLQEVVVPSCKPVTLLNGAFINCVSLENFDCEFFVLDSYALSNCPKLTNIVFSHGARWKSTTFQGSKQIKDITFLGNIGKDLTNGDIRWLKCRNIKCHIESELAELSYIGANIELF